MPAAPLPPDESARLHALRELDILDSSPEPEFDALVKVAALVCGVPISLISLIDAERQWFKANLGLPRVSETPRELAFCAHAILGDDVFEIPDATQDPRFSDNALVTSDPHIRFYAGAPLRMADGSRVGTLCVIDRMPRQLNATQREVLGQLAVAATKALEGRRAARVERELLEKKQQIEASFLALSNSVPIGIYATDAQGACIYTNPRWQEIYGLSAEQSLGDGWSKAVHPDDQEKVIAEWRRTTTEPSAFELEFRIQHHDGGIRHVRAMAKRTTKTDGTVTGFIGSVEDVTERVAQSRQIQETHARITLATDAGQIGIWEYDVAKADQTWNPWMYRLHGLAVGADRGTFEQRQGTVHRDDRELVVASMKNALAGIGLFNIAYRIVWPDGSIHHLRTTAKLVRNNVGHAVKLIGATWDVTPLRLLADKLAEEHELLRVTLQSIGDAVITTDADGRITWLNPVAERMTGWLNGEAKSRPLAQVFHIVSEETRELAESPIERCLTQKEVAGLASHTLLLSRNGEEFGIEDSAAPIHNQVGELLGMVLVFHDVTEQRRMSGEMTYRATHDVLTGLVNRAEFETRLRRALNNAHEQRGEHALMFIDLDQFKLVNDACGHSVGDQLLQQVSKILTEVVRNRDTLARLGGDEFGVILEHCSTEHAQRLAAQICDRMDEFRFIHDGRRFRIGASIGLVAVNSRWSDATAIMRAADTACYAAKEAGRNRVHTWFDTDLALRARSGETQWVARIEQALDDNGFVLFAQRIEGLHDGVRGLHAEILLRMIEPDGKVILPGVFLPAAERFHLASRIDRWVLQRATQWLVALPNGDAIDTLCINLSGQSIGDRAFHRHAIEMLASLGRVICAKLCLEITETAAVTNMADAVLFVEQVRALGVRMALDDFGAGASSFGYLKTLPVDILKIDGQFVKGLNNDPLSEAAVRCFVDVAKVTGLKTVAEFVDTTEILARLREIGVDYAQGFLLHKPEPIQNIFAVDARIANGALELVTS